MGCSFGLILIILVKFVALCSLSSGYHVMQLKRGNLLSNNFIYVNRINASTACIIVCACTESEMHDLKNKANNSQSNHQPDSQRLRATGRAGVKDNTL